jgi:hypothetical protein
MEIINFESLLSESREDIFVPELENEEDTGYFDIDVDWKEIPFIQEGDENDSLFSSFDCINTYQVIDQNIDFVERKQSISNFGEDGDTEEDIDEDDEDNENGNQKQQRNTIQNLRSYRTALN